MQHERTGPGRKGAGLPVPFTWRGRKFRFVGHAIKAFPQDSPKQITLHAARQMAFANARLARPTEPDPGALPEVYPPGIEPPPKPKSKAEARRLRVAAAKARAKPPEPDPVLAGLAAALDLPPLQLDLERLTRF
jgi:hypothetical protein